ncbi:MAG: fibronectin type III domain-containing protein [Puniceicoccaceae bacterium 5H]|nr:MAG: fibronectin type III domain-containing protein [Puniceicoccaceae bacterium 5H]
MPCNFLHTPDPDAVSRICHALRGAILVGGLSLLAVGGVQLSAASQDALPANKAVKVVPVPFDGALRNPLMGITARELAVHEWGTLTHHYLGWNELEAKESDGVEKIRALCDEAWSGFPEKNIKVIPRVYLQYPGLADAWPEGLEAGDYTSAEFQRRLRLFVAKLGEAWDEDPRVAYVEMGLFGKWGEHHSPAPTEEMERVAGEAFQQAFPHKQVSVRRVWETFDGYDFGEYWDSFAHWDEMATNGRKIADYQQETGFYQHHYVGGEVAYDWGNWKIQPGETPTLSLADPNHLSYVLNTVHWLQCTQLRWIGDYDRDDPKAVAGAAQLQRALGYRFELDSVTYTAMVGEDARLHVVVDITNTGSAPFYYPWPFEVSLLDPHDRRVVWRGIFNDADPRAWLPGESTIDPHWVQADDDNMPRAFWPDHVIEDWCQPPAPHRVEGVFHPEVPTGQYVLALALLDPAGMRPAVHFATAQYWKGGRHPIGMVGFGGKTGGPLPSETTFDDPVLDPTLGYDPKR